MKNYHNTKEYFRNAIKCNQLFLGLERARRSESEKITSLWRMVILQAVMDYYYPVGLDWQRKKIQGEAKAWIDGGGKDFATACDMAGWPLHFPKRMLDVLESTNLLAGVRWR